MPRPVPSRRRRLTSRLPPDTVTAAEPRHQPPPRRDNPGGPLAPPRRASAAPVADLPCSAAAAAIPPPPPLARELMQQRARKRRPAPPRPPLRYFRRAPRVTTATGEHRLPAKAAGGRASRGRAPSPQERRLKRPPSQHSTAQHRAPRPPTRSAQSQPQLVAQPGFYCSASNVSGSGRTGTTRNAIVSEAKALQAPQKRQQPPLRCRCPGSNSTVLPRAKGSASWSTSLPSWHPSLIPDNSKALVKATTGGRVNADGVKSLPAPRVKVRRRSSPCRRFY